MTNIYVSHLASPSFERLSGAVERLPNEFPLIGEAKQERVRNLDENGNEIFETAKKTSGTMKGNSYFRGFLLQITLLSRVTRRLYCMRLKRTSNSACATDVSQLCVFRAVCRNRYED